MQVSISGRTSSKQADQRRKLGTKAHVLGAVTYPLNFPDRLAAQINSQPGVLGVDFVKSPRDVKPSYKSL